MPQHTKSHTSTVVGIDHVAITCPAGSEPALRAFYTGLLNMPEQPKPPALAHRGGAWFAAGHQQLHCSVQHNFQPTTKGHPCFVVTELNHLAQQLTHAGHNITWDHTIPTIPRFFTTDPVGNRLELMSAFPDTSTTP